VAHALAKAISAGRKRRSKKKTDFMPNSYDIEQLLLERDVAMQLSRRARGKAHNQAHLPHPLRVC